MATDIPDAETPVPPAELVIALELLAFEVHVLEVWLLVVADEQRRARESRAFGSVAAGAESVPEQVASRSCVPSDYLKE